MYDSKVVQNLLYFRARGFSLCTDKKSLFVTGSGSSFSSCPNAQKVEQYDPHKDVWTELPDLNYRTEFFQLSCCLKDNLYVFNMDN